MRTRISKAYEKATLITAAFLLCAITATSLNLNHILGGLSAAQPADAKPFFSLINKFSSDIKAEPDDTVYTAKPINELTKTPEDILQLIAAAEEKAESEKEDGKISEREYDGSGAKAKIGNIWVRNNNQTQQNINLLKYYEAAPEIKITDKSQPAVLIFHTHTTESYEMLDRGWYAQGYITRSNSSDRNMVRVGMEIKEKLEKHCFTVIHDTQIHDVKYTGAYAHSRESVEKYLKEYPSIQVVLDIHRDAIETDKGVRIKPTSTIMGKKAAQIMIITGCEEGKVTDFPEWEYNLTFALKLQSVCEEKYPGLMRPIYFCQRKYNMDCSQNNLLVEMGSCANTLEEAAYSGRLLGDALATMLEEAKA